jgi:hypothetical protein
MDFLYRRKDQNSQNVNDEDERVTAGFIFSAVVSGGVRKRSLSGAILLRDERPGTGALLSRETRARNAVQLIELIRRSFSLVYEHRLGSFFCLRHR